MEPKTTETSTRRPAAAVSVLLAALMAFYTTQLDSVWRYPLGIVAIILVVVAIRNLRRGGQ